MQQTFEYLWSALLSEVPQLPVPLAKRYISDAWLEIQNMREWSFRHQDGLLVLPAEITTGTISLTQYSNSGTLDATALAAWNALGSAIPNLAYRQLRFPSQSDEIFNIDSVDLGTGVITFDKMYLGSTDVDSTYRLYSVYGLPHNKLGVPDPYFTRFKSLRSIDYGYTMLDTKNRIERRILDANDPGRVHCGLPFAYCYSHDKSYTSEDNTLQYRLYEFWPHTTAQISFQTRYIRRAISFEESPDQTLPEIIPPRMVISRALLDSYRWAEAHSNTHPELARKNWQYLRAQLASKYPTDHDTYPELLRRATIDDNNILNQELLANPIHNERLMAIPMTLVVSP